MGNSITPGHRGSSCSWRWSSAPADSLRLSLPHKQRAGCIATPCRAVRSELGLAVSVGVAPNKLLAKLASAAAKPDGVLVVDSEAATQQLLASTPARRLPQMGGQVAQAFQRSELQEESAIEGGAHVPAVAVVGVATCGMATPKNLRQLVGAA